MAWRQAKNADGGKHRAVLLHALIIICRHQDLGVGRLSYMKIWSFPYSVGSIPALDDIFHQKVNWKACTGSFVKDQKVYHLFFFVMTQNPMTCEAFISYCDQCIT
jgi:hypothetical protein